MDLQRPQGQQPERRKAPLQRVPENSSPRRTLARARDDDDKILGRKIRLTRSDPDDEVVNSKERAAARRQAAKELLILDLVICGVCGVLGFAALIPIFFAPEMGVLVLFLALTVGIYAFVTGCVRAAREHSYVDFDYLEFLGGWRWILGLLFLAGTIVGIVTGSTRGWRWVLGILFITPYIAGYMLLWLVAQITSACQAPKRLLPCLGLQGFALFLAGFAGIAMAISDGQSSNSDSSSSSSGSSAQRSNRNTGADLPAQQQKPPRIVVQNPPPDLRNPPPDVVQNPPPDFRNPPPPDFGIPKEPEPPVVTGNVELDKLLAKLGSKDVFQIQPAADKLATLQPDEQSRPLVARKLAEALKTANPFTRVSILKALVTWYTDEQVPVLIGILNSKDIQQPVNEVLQVIGKTHDERFVEPVVGLLGDFFFSGPAEKAVKDLGPVAEPAILALLSNPAKKMVWMTGIRLLKDIGTEKSFPLLEKGTRDPMYRLACADALIGIRARLMNK